MVSHPSRDTAKPWSFEGEDSWAVPIETDWVGLGRRVVEMIDDPILQASHWSGYVRQLDEIALVKYDRSREPCLGATPEPAILMRWRQGESSFGLIATVAHLAYQNSSATPEGIAQLLILAINEPQGPKGGTTLWMNALPSANNY